MTFFSSTCHRRSEMSSLQKSPLSGPIDGIKMVSLFRLTIYNRFDHASNTIKFIFFIQFELIIHHQHVYRKILGIMSRYRSVALSFIPRSPKVKHFLFLRAKSHCHLFQNERKEYEKSSLTLLFPKTHSFILNNSRA